MEDGTQILQITHLLEGSYFYNCKDFKSATGPRMATSVASSSSLPYEVRLRCRRNDPSLTQTAGQALGFAQANLVILSSKELSFDFLLFCQRNPKSCPLIAVLEAGQYCYRSRDDDVGTDENTMIDIRTDLPRYRVFRDGKLVDEVSSIESLWQDSFYTFVIGCSFSFEGALVQAGLRVRHIDMNRNVPMYNTNIPCKSAGVFSGNLVVSMRPFKPSDVVSAVQISSRFPRVHGAPVHIGDPTQLGISDISKPDYGDSVDIYCDEVPVFWACGVTPQAVVMNSKPDLCITHAPGCMLVLDIRNDELAL
jgi:uncharacterized protein YcsI (UPF0317 family)